MFVHFPSFWSVLLLHGIQVGRQGRANQENHLAKARLHSCFPARQRRPFATRSVDDSVVSPSNGQESNQGQLQERLKIGETGSSKVECHWHWKVTCRSKSKHQGQASHRVNRGSSAMGAKQQQMIWKKYMRAPNIACEHSWRVHTQTGRILCVRGCFDEQRSSRNVQYVYCICTANFVQYRVSSPGPHTWCCLAFPILPGFLAARTQRSRRPRLNYLNRLEAFECKMHSDEWNLGLKAMCATIVMPTVHMSVSLLLRHWTNQAQHEEGSRNTAARLV